MKNTHRLILINILEMEEWKDIEGYEGLYQVSNEGNAKSLNYNHTGREKLLKPSVRGNGYLQVQLCKDGKKENKDIHRLVAEAFIPNPNNYEIVHHIDHNRQNNVVENLMWMNKEEHDKVHSKERGEKKEKRVYQYTLDSKLVAIWKSAKEAEKQLGFAQSHISSCCNGKLKQYKGYIWSYTPL